MENINFQAKNNVIKQKDPVKPVSLMSPWTLEDKMCFRTTSNAYGNHYKFKWKEDEIINETKTDEYVKLFI